MRISLLTLTCLAFTLALAVGCADAAPTPTSTPLPGSDIGTIVVQAPIESVDIEKVAAKPPNASLIVVSGGLNSCESFNDYTMTRDGDTFQVEVTNLKQVGLGLPCTANYGMVTTSILLPSNLIEPCKTYTVVVNGESYSVRASCPIIASGQFPEPTATPTSTPTLTETPGLVLSILDRQCTSSHTTKIPGSPGLLCSVEVPNVAIYSDGSAIYHVWKEKYYGSRIGGELYTGQLSLERLEELLTRFDGAGVFRIEGTSARGDAAYYIISANFGGEEASLVLDPWFGTQEEEQLLELVEELLIFREWATQGTGFQEIGKFDLTNIRLRTDIAIAPAMTDWPLSGIHVQDGLILSSERSEEVQELIPLGWFGHYSYQEKDYVVGYVPQYPHGWP